MRTFEEILADEKNNRNILTVKMTKIVKYVDGKEDRPPSLNMEDVGELLFDIVKLDVNDCIGLSLSTQRYDTKAIKLKSNVDPAKYTTQTPLEFKGHLIVITKEVMGSIKVTFRDVPDEELINLCEVYGVPLNNHVHYEQMPKAYRGLRGPNRSVNIKMTPGKQFENFYWMEGPLEEDRGCRITVLHSGQEQQCSHCLRRSNCPAKGNGRACQSLNTPRGKISDYMRYLKETHNYVSLKMKHKIKLEQEFPALGRRKFEDDGFSHMVEVVDTEEENKEPMVVCSKTDLTDQKTEETENILKV